MPPEPLASTAAWYDRPGYLPAQRSASGVVTRLLGLVAEVRRDEVGTALLMALNGFLLVAAYALVKPVREVLLLAQPGGAEYKVYTAGATALVLMLAVPLYSRASRNIPRNWLITGVTLFFASHLLAFYSLTRSLGRSLAVALAFYLWIAVFNMMIVAQFWSFANDLYDEPTGERLFPLLGLGVSLGAVVGAGIASAVLTRVGPREMMLLAVLPLVLSAAVVEWVHRREVRRASTVIQRETAEYPIGGSAGTAFRIVFGRRYLMLIACFSLLFTLVKTNGDYVLARIVQGAAAHAAGGNEAFLGRFFADYQLRVDLAGLVIQALLVSRLVKYVGVRAALFIFPCVALGDAAVMVALPLLAAVALGKTVESALDYSLNNTLRGILWLPTSRRAKYLAKQAVDTFFVRLGDVMSAALVFLAVKHLGLPLGGFAAVNVALIGAGLLVTYGIVRERARLVGAVAGHAGGGDPIRRAEIGTAVLLERAT